ncbi:hypothetical protein OJ996_11240 [Luteolibacter sp. GHJ8]|uniref:Uncharacterized protein n=1 Tax=Luteolibacter rhizosphaerae TaxID=2989719 RepID=A0ABT3G3M7_9BACT|nr:hypothetical protein [Luteolibacter rhizosphaerae]MCW1914154.1 hypothetical protein [Luteolibacter rhizosphaerae]
MRNRIALAFFILALIAFTAFHFLPWSKTSDRTSWELWKVVASPLGMRPIPDAGFLMSSLLFVSSPLLVGVFRRSALALWGTRVMSLLALACLSGALAYLVAMELVPLKPNAGGYVLVAAQILHLAGSFIARIDRLPAGPPP